MSSFVTSPDGKVEFVSNSNMLPGAEVFALPVRVALGDTLGLYVYVPLNGCGRLSLPAMNTEVLGSVGSRAEPTNCCDSGGRDIDNGFILRTCDLVDEAMGMKPGTVGDVVPICDDGLPCAEVGVGGLFDVFCGDGGW